MKSHVGVAASSDEDLCLVHLSADEQMIERQKGRATDGGRERRNDAGEQTVLQPGQLKGVCVAPVKRRMLHLHAPQQKVGMVLLCSRVCVLGVVLLCSHTEDLHVHPCSVRLEGTLIVSIRKSNLFPIERVKISTHITSTHTFQSHPKGAAHDATPAGVRHV